MGHTSGGQGDCHKDRVCALRVSEVAENPASGGPPAHKAVVPPGNWSGQEQPPSRFPPTGRSELHKRELLELIQSRSASAVRQVRSRDRAHPAAVHELHRKAGNARR